MLIRIALTSDRSLDAVAVEFGRPLVKLIWDHTDGVSFADLRKVVDDWFDERNEAGENPHGFSLSDDMLRKLRRISLLSWSFDTFEHTTGVRIPRGTVE